MCKGIGGEGGGGRPGKRIAGGWPPRPWGAFPTFDLSDCPVQMSGIQSEGESESRRFTSSAAARNRRGRSSE